MWWSLAAQSADRAINEISRDEDLPGYFERPSACPSTNAKLANDMRVRNGPDCYACPNFRAVDLWTLDNHVCACDCPHFKAL
jgi:hypothetical protein